VLKTPAAEQHRQVQKQEFGLARVAQTWEDGTEDRLGLGEEDLRGYARIRTLVLNGGNKASAARMSRGITVAGGEIIPTNN
jgi:hypothetical protein